MHVAKIYIENNEDYGKTDIYKLQLLINALHNTAFKVRRDYKFAISLPELSNENMNFGNELLLYSNSKIDLLEHLEQKEVKEIISNMNYELLDTDQENIKFYISTFKRTYGKKASPSAIKKAIEWIQGKKNYKFKEGTYNYKIQQMLNDGKSIKDMSRELKGRYLSLLLNSKSNSMKYYIALDVEISDHNLNNEIYLNNVDSNGFSNIRNKVFLPYV